MYAAAASRSRRAAEEFVFGEPDAGSASDLKRATETARAMVTQLGMSDRLGRPAYGTNGASGHHGPETMTLIDAEIRTLVDQAADRARQVLTAHRDAFEAIAAALAERETLTADDLDELADLGEPTHLPPAGT